MLANDIGEFFVQKIADFDGRDRAVWRCSSSCTYKNDKYVIRFWVFPDESLSRR